MQYEITVECKNSVGYEPAQDEPTGWLELAWLVSEAGSSRLDPGKLGLSRLELKKKNDVRRVEAGSGEGRSGRPERGNRNSRRMKKLK